MADHSPTPNTNDHSDEKLSWKLFALLVAGAGAFIGAAIYLAP